MFKIWNLNLNKKLWTLCPMAGKESCCPRGGAVTASSLSGFVACSFSTSKDRQAFRSKQGRLSLRVVPQKVDQDRSLAPGSSSLLRLQLARDWCPP